ncbi:hypothetical protein ACHAXH_001578 [Discostella pseudostelligera]
METRMTRYLIALAAVTAAHAFSSVASTIKNDVPREEREPPLHYLSGGVCHCQRRRRQLKFTSSTFAATARENDAASSSFDDRLDGTTRSIFEQMFRIQMPWDTYDDTPPPPSSSPSPSQPRSSTSWQWQWPNSRNSPSPAYTPFNKKSPPSLSVSNRIDVEKHVPPDHNTMISTSFDENNLPIDFDTNDNIKVTRWDTAAATATATNYSEVSSVGDIKIISTSKVIVRAAHMEIATPSIETQLRQLVIQDKVTHAMCVPYFLGPGKHATVDVPKLINEARDRLDKEGFLEYCYCDDNDEGGGGSGGTDGKMKRVEIHTTMSVGSNVESMLDAVDDLVRRALKESEGDTITFQLDIHNGHNANEGEKQTSYGLYNSDASTVTTTNELQRYSNRAALLQNVLQMNKKRLKTMTNRASLLENALKQIQITWKKEQEESCETREKQEKKFAEKVANLTSVIEVMTFEKDTIMRTFEHRRIDMEKEYNATIDNLEAKISLMDQELMRIEDESKRATLDMEERKSYLEEELDEKSRQQQDRIQKLQMKLADLLDAYAQLEQLQNDTERAMHDTNAQLKELNVTYESSLMKEREEKEKFRIQWMEAQRQLEQNDARLHRLLNDTTSKYEALLEVERDKANEWKGKWEAMKDEQRSSGNLELSRNFTDDPLQSSTATELELNEASKFNADANDRIQALETELNQQKEQYESSSAQKDEQHQQLQKYLRAQLSTYYETIQSQLSQIMKFEEEIFDMGLRHNESILIATSSVEASQHREENLLKNIEELESELIIANKDRDSRLDKLRDFQARLHKMEDHRSRSEMLERRNDELTMKIELLERKMIEVTQQKDQALAENKSILLERSEEAGKNELDTSLSPQPQRQRFKRVRAIFRPFALFRRK